MDNIVYINLNKRTDRKEQITNELNNYGLTYERFEAIHEEQGILGCTKSHLEVLKLARKNGWKSVLILEDDFTFLVSREEFEFEIKQLMESGINYDVCMLAYNLIRGENISGCNFLHRVLEAQTASAYIVKDHYYDVIINLYEEAVQLLGQTGEHWNYANDQCWKSLQRKDNWIRTKTRIGKQIAGYSDNTCSYTDYNC
jgi:glycosyl transferase family 25